MSEADFIPEAPRNKNSNQVTDQANFIWNIAKKLRGAYMPDKYGDVIIPMTIVRRFECSLADTKKEILENYEKNNNLPAQFLYKISGYQFYNTSRYTLAELCNDPNNIAANFKEYISGFSQNVRDILSGLDLDSHIKKMDKEGCLYSVVKDFSELDLSPETYDSVQMGYIFENLIGRFFENVDAGQFYTGRDIIKMLVEVLMSEGCDDLKDPQKVVTVCDQACGTGGMLSTAFDSIKAMNPSANVRLFGQEYNSVSWSIGLAEMLIKGQNSENFRHADTFKEDCFPNQKMRLVIENPPFGTPWAGNDAKQGQEEAVRNEFRKGRDGRWGAGLPSGGDSQMLFLQSAVDKMDDANGRAAIIENYSPMSTGNTLSGESQIRRFLLERDLIEAIIALPQDLFYNTSIQTYVWILSKNKRQERRGKVQLIDASNFYHRLRKLMGLKKNEITDSDRKKIVDIYNKFEDSDSKYSKVFPNSEFIYKEYTIMQPMQRGYAITSDRIDKMLTSGCLNNLYNPTKVAALESAIKLSSKEQKQLDVYHKNKPIYDSIVNELKSSVSHSKYDEKSAFLPVLNNVLSSITSDIKLINKIADGLSEFDETAKIQYKKNGEVLFDKETKDSEVVKIGKSVDDFMNKEILPYRPTAKWFDEDKIGAEIPFIRYFYNFEEPEASDELERKILKSSEELEKRFVKLFKEV